MKFKEGVVLELVPEMSRVLPEIDAAHADVGIERDTVITSAHDGTHMKGSLHYEMKAVDLRTKDLVDEQISKLERRLRVRLNGHELKNRPYQVIVENTPKHIHIEYQP